MIEVEGLTKRYGSRVVVDDISFSVPEGELLVLIGRSGSGKTTTLKMLNRLIERSGGNVRIGGEDVMRTEPHALRRRIGYVFQKIGLFPHLTVEENIWLTPSLVGWRAEDREGRVLELLNLLELPSELRHRMPHELSGGQQQRVGFARALAAKPRFMLLDEPFGALDPLTRDRLQQSFARIRRTLGLTAILVTHDMTEAVTLADRIGILREGRLVQLDTPARVLGQPADDYVAELFATPRRQAEAFARALANGTP
jgi:osmoprotectant transport system ATP-binding protein